MNHALILYSSFLYYRRKDVYWPTHTIRNAFLVTAFLTAYFVLHHWSALLFAGVVLLVLELPRWFDKPRCLIRDGVVTVKRLMNTYRTFRMDELYAMGRYQEVEAQPMLFLCAASADTIKRFSEKHKKELTIVANHYGYEPDTLSEDELMQVMLTLYLWKKAKASNPSSAMLCITKKSWAKLDSYCASHQLPYITLSAPKGGCYREY